MARNARNNRYEIDYLMSDPLVRLRMSLAKASKTGLNDEQYQDFLNDMRKNLGSVRYIDYYADMARKFLETGEDIDEALHLSDPLSQLVWSATFIHMLSDYEGFYERWAIAKKNKTHSPDDPANDNGSDDDVLDVQVKPIEENVLYQRLLNDRTIKRVMLDYAYNVTQMTKNPDVRFKWGKPGSWFFYNLQENSINIDLLQTLIGGFRDTLSIVFHEIGHSQLTLAWPKEQKKMMDELEPFTEKIKKKQKLSQEEYKRYRVLSKQLALRHRLSDACENAPVNRFTAGRRGSLGFGLRRSLNRIFMEVSGGGILYLKNQAKKAEGEKSEEQKAREAAEKQVDNLLEQFTGQKKKKRRHDDDLIPSGDVDENSNEAQFQNVIWVINTVFYQNNNLFGLKKSEWEKVGVRPEQIKLDPDIRDEVLAQFPQALEHWNPDLAVLVELCGGEEGLENLQPQASDRYKYGKDYFNLQADHYMKKRNDVNQNIWDWYLKKLADEQLEEEEQKAEEDLENKQDGGGDGQDQDGEGQEGQEQDGQGQGQGQGKGQKGDQQGGQGGGGQGQEQGDDNTIEVEGAGDMPDPNPPPDPEDVPGNGQDKDGQDGQDADGEGQDADGEGQDADGGGDPGDGQGQGKTLEELMEEYKKSLEQGDPSQDKGDPGDQAGNGEGATKLEDLAEGSFADYQALVAQLQAEINQTVRLLDNLRKKQLRSKREVSKSNHSLTPEQNDIHRLDRDRHINKIKQTNPTLEDRKLFKTTRDFNTPADFEFTLGIDGSSSMLGPGSGADAMKGVHPLKIAVLKSIIIYEACRRLNQNAYIYIWGNEAPIMLAEPGDSYQKIGENMKRIEEKGLQCGTDILPAFEKIVHATAFNRKKTRPLSGYTFHMIFSDGDVFGKRDEMVSRCQDILQKGILQSIDFDIIRKNSAGTSAPALVEVAKEIDNHDPKKNVGVHVSTTEKVDFEGTLDLIIKKMLGQPVKAVPTGKKKKSLQRIAMRWGL